MFSFDPIVRSLEGIQRELARGNDLAERKQRLISLRYSQQAETEKSMLEGQRMSIELSALAHGYEKNDEGGYTFTPRSKPERL